MKKIVFIIIATCLQIPGMAQTTGLDLDALIKKLNEEIAPTILFDFKNDTVRLEILGHRSGFLLPRLEGNNVMPFSGGIRYNPNRNPWRYDIQPISISKSKFYINNRGQLHLSLIFNTPTGIYITAQPPPPRGCVINSDDYTIQHAIWSGNTSIDLKFQWYETKEHFFLTLESIEFLGFINPMDGKRRRWSFKAPLEKYLAKRLGYYFKRESLAKDLKTKLYPNKT